MNEKKAINNELNERIALAMGWHFNPENEKWFNHFGVQISHLPDFSGSQTGIEAITNYFSSVTKDEFFSEFHQRMTPEQVCKLALKALKK